MWEYKVIQLHSYSEATLRDIEFHLNRLGREGWELAFYIPGALFLKRRLDAEEAVA